MPIAQYKISTTSYQVHPNEWCLPPAICITRIIRRAKVLLRPVTPHIKWYPPSARLSPVYYKVYNPPNLIPCTYQAGCQIQWHNCTFLNIKSTQIINSLMSTTCLPVSSPGLLSNQMTVRHWSENYHPLLPPITHNHPFVASFQDVTSDVMIWLRQCDILLVCIPNLAIPCKITPYRYQIIPHQIMQSCTMQYYIHAHCNAMCKHLISLWLPSHT